MEGALMVAPLYDGVCNVQLNFDTYYKLLVNKVIGMVEVENLPPTVDETYMLTSLILNGFVCLGKHNGKLYAFSGSIGGEPNVYYEPMQFIVANPVVGSETYTVRRKDGDRENLEGIDGALITLTAVDELRAACSAPAPGGGLSGLIYQTAGLLADNISSLNVAQINTRVGALFTADSDAQARGAEIMLRELYGGKPYTVLRQNIVEQIGVNPISQQHVGLMELIEAHQYILAQFYNEIGVQAGYNMKRERLNTAEVELGNGALEYNIADIVKHIKEGFDRANKLFGTEISVRLKQEVELAEAKAEEEAQFVEEASPSAATPKVDEPEEQPEEEEVVEEVKKEVEEVKEADDE